MFILSVIPVCIVYSLQCVTGSFEESIILTSFHSNSLQPQTENIFMSQGNPYDLQNNSLNFGNILSGNPSTKYTSCDVDYSKQILYLHDQTTASIVAIEHFDWRNNFGSRLLTPFHYGVSVADVKVSVDWISHNVYWTDPLYRWIAMQPGVSDTADNSQYTIIVEEDMERPYGLAVDPVHGDISSTSKIERASLSGRNRTTLISTGLSQPTSIDVDLVTSRIIWVDAYRDTVESATFDGENRKTIRRISNSHLFDVAMFRDIISVIDFSVGALRMLNKHNGEEIGSNIGFKDAKLFGLAIYSSEIQPLDTQTNYCSLKQCSHMCVSGTRSAECLCKEGYRLNVDGITCKESAGGFHRALVVTNTTHVCLMDIRILASDVYAGRPACFFTSDLNISFIDIDAIGRKIIYATGSDIFTANIAHNSVSQRVISETSTVNGLALDWTDNNIYWSMGDTDGSINVVSQQSLTKYTLLYTELIYPRDLILLPLDRKMIWISERSGNIISEKADMDGTGRETIVRSGTLTLPTSLAIDSSNNDCNVILQIHTDKGDPVEATNTTNRVADSVLLSLLMSNVRNNNSSHAPRTGLSVSIGLITAISEGTIKMDQMETIAKGVITAPKLLLVYKNHLVVTENAFSASILETLDKESPTSKRQEIRLNDLGLVTNINVLDVSRQPKQKGPCDTLNGNCEHVCIPIGHTKICKCEYGFMLDANKETYSSSPLSDNFLIVTDWTHNKMYQVSLDTDEVRALDTEITGSPNAIAYNYMTRHVIWGDTSSGYVHTIDINGTDYSILSNTGVYGSYPERFAIDYTSGNIFYTSVQLAAAGFVGVGVISANGAHKKLILSDGRPRDIVVDPQEGLLFWTDHNALSPFVKRANMDGTSVTTILANNIVWPNGLALDVQETMLYLADGYLNTIQRCTYIGVCTRINTDNGAHLMDIGLMGDYLYYTAWNRQFITKIHKHDSTDVTPLSMHAELGRLNALYVYRSTAQRQPEANACQARNGLGECSTFCLPTTAGYMCTCEDGVNLKRDRKTCENAESTINLIPTSESTIPATETQKEANTAVIIGASSGALVVVVVIVVIIIVIIILVIRRRLRNRTEAHSLQEPFPNPHYNGFIDTSATFGDSDYAVIVSPPNIDVDNSSWNTEDNIDRANTLYNYVNGNTGTNYSTGASSVASEDSLQRNIENPIYQTQAHASYLEPIFEQRQPQSTRLDMDTLGINSNYLTPI